MTVGKQRTRAVDGYRRAGVGEPACATAQIPPVVERRSRRRRRRGTARRGATRGAVNEVHSAHPLPLPSRVRDGVRASLAAVPRRAGRRFLVSRLLRSPDALHLPCFSHATARSAAFAPICTVRTRATAPTMRGTYVHVGT